MFVSRSGLELMFKGGQHQSRKPISVHAGAVELLRRPPIVYDDHAVELLLFEVVQ